MLRPAPRQLKSGTHCKERSREQQKSELIRTAFDRCCGHNQLIVATSDYDPGCYETRMLIAFPHSSTGHGMKRFITTSVEADLSAPRRCK